MKNNMLLSSVAVAALVAGVLLSGKSASAQTPVNPLLPTKGTREIQLAGNFIFSPSDSQSENLNLGYGVFLSAPLEVGAQVGYAHSKGGSTAYNVVGVADYHFPSASALLPFAGIELGYQHLSGGGNDAFIYGLRGGVKYFLNPNVSANGILNYNQSDRSGSKSEFGLNLGLSVYLR